MRDDWTTDPYTLVEKDGYFYGRGTTDDKQFCAIFAAAFAQLKREGFVPDRDLVLALTTGEEQGTNETSNGIMWLLKHHRPLDRRGVRDQRRRRWRQHRAGWPLHLLRRPGRREALRRLHARGDARRRPQLAARGGQSHLSDRPRAVAGGDAAAANAGGTRDPAVSRVSRDRRVGPEGRRSSRGCRHAAGPGRHGAACRRGSELERAVAHDLRGHAGHGRTRAQRVAAARPGQRQLPHPARRHTRADPRGPGQGHRRPRGDA